MTAQLKRPATQDGLFLWVMHRFSEVFEEHAVIKGGMALKLLDSQRHTMDIDYVFVPFSSKKRIAEQIDAVLHEIDGAEITLELHSQMMCAELRVDDAAILIEANVATECKAIPMATGNFARSVGHPSQVVRVMNPAHALAHKIAAWNERRLLRDLYDCYFLISHAGVLPHLETLDLRLSKVKSRLPRLKKRRSMSRSQLIFELRQTTSGLTDQDLESELAGLLPSEEFPGLALRIRAVVERINAFLLPD